VFSSGIGQSVAVAHDPPKITLHSVQDGRKRLTLPVDPSSTTGSSRVTGLWWFRDEKPTSTSTIPDIFKRRGVIVKRFVSVVPIELLIAIQDGYCPRYLEDSTPPG
jgi:hypothetical protein